MPSKVPPNQLRLSQGPDGFLKSIDTLMEQVDNQRYDSSFSDKMANSSLIKRAKIKQAAMSPVDVNQLKIVATPLKKPITSMAGGADENNSDMRRYCTQAKTPNQGKDASQADLVQSHPIRLDFTGEAHHP